MQSVHTILEEIKKESPDLYDALEKVIVNARISLAVKKVNNATPLTEGEDSSVGSHPHP